MTCITTPAPGEGSNAENGTKACDEERREYAHIALALALLPIIFGVINLIRMPRLHGKLGADTLVLHPHPRAQRGREYRGVPGCGARFPDRLRSRWW